MLLGHGNPSNSRPLYSVTAWLISQPLRALAGCCLPETARRIENSEHLPAYTAYIIINWVLLWLAVILFFKLLPDDPKHWAIFVFTGILLAVNEVTKAFFWTPHLQICNIFVPVVALFILRHERKFNVGVRRQFWCGVMVGAATLFYGAFAVIAGAKAIYLLFRREAEGGVSGNSFTIIKRVQSVLMLTIGFLILPVAWVAFVNRQGGGFHSLEVDKYRQFVWLFGAIRGEEGFWGEFAGNMMRFAATLPEVVALPGLILLVLFAVERIWLLPARAAKPERRMVAEVEIVLYQFLAVLLFYSLMGFYATRLTWALVPGMLFLIALKLQLLFDGRMSEKARKLTGWLLSTTSLLYVIYWIVRPGPYS